MVMSNGEGNRANPSATEEHKSKMMKIILPIFHPLR